LIGRLSAAEEIRSLKARYSAAADAKYTPAMRPHSEPLLSKAAWEQALCFTEDAVLDGGVINGLIVGRQQLYAFFRDPPWSFATHLYTSSQLEIRKDDASGTWRLWQIGIARDKIETTLLIGQSREHYRLTSTGWLVDRMTFDSLHKLTVAVEPNALVCLSPSQGRMP
jgi:hypothetical protein